MNWILSPLKMTRSLFATGALFTMCLSPLAEAKKAETVQKAQQKVQLSQAQKVNMFLKETKLNESGRTWGDYWRQVRHAFPQKTRKSFDNVVAQHRNEPMPKVEATTYKDANNKEQLRLTLTSKDGQVVNLTFTGDEQKPMKVNGVNLSKSDMFSFPRLVAKVQKDPQIAKGLKGKKIHREFFAKDTVLSYKEYKRLTVRQKAEYMYRMRDMIETAQNIYRAKYGEVAMNDYNSKYQVVLDMLFGEDAYAAGVWPKKDDGCVNAGYISKYGSASAKKLSCIEVKEPNSTCGGDVTCNPMFYGYNSSGGNYCVPRVQRIDATRICNKQSPIDTNAQKKAIIEGYMKKIHNKDFDEKALKDYYALSQEYLNNAATMCSTEPSASVREKLNDLDRACIALQERAISLQDFAVNPQPPVVLPAPVGGVKDCAATYAIGSELQDDGKTCKCPHGEPVVDENDKTGQRKICKADSDIFAAGAVVPGEKDDDDDDSCWYCAWWKPAAMILGAGLIGWGIYEWLRGDDDDDDDNDQGYITPVYPGPDTPTTPPVTTPTDPECAPGTVRQVPGGPCVPTVITPIPEPPVTPPVTPPATPGEGSGTGPDDILSGGIQQR